MYVRMNSQTVLNTEHCIKWTVETFATVLDACWRSVVLITPPQL